MGSQYHYNDLKKLKTEDFNSNLKLHQTELEKQNECMQVANHEVTLANEKYHQLYYTAPVGLFSLNEKGLIIDVNHTGATLLGVAKEKLINQCFSRYIAPESNSFYSNHHQQILKTGKEETCEIKLLKRNGPIFYAYLISQLIPSDNKKEILNIVVDITDKKNKEHYLEEQYELQVAEKTSTMNTMLTSIVHELNHPLAVITNFIQGAIRRLESGDYEINQILQALKKAVQQSDRAADIILRMKNFNNHGTIKREELNINNLLKETVELIQYETYGFPVTVLLRPCSNNIQIRADKAQLQQVLINLARNAIEAMKDAGTTSPKLAIECAQIATDFIEISVVDNGPGFDKEDSHKLIAPGFTTKSYGIGLGLAMSRKMIETHGGKLSIELNPTDGACFKFTLPLKDNIPA